MAKTAQARKRAEGRHPGTLECDCFLRWPDEDSPEWPYIHYCPLHEAAPALRRAIGGLMEIAEQAMPDTYFQTDRRVKAARAATRAAEGKV